MGDSRNVVNREIARAEKISRDQEVGWPECRNVSRTRQGIFPTYFGGRSIRLQQVVHLQRQGARADTSAARLRAPHSARQSSLSAGPSLNERPIEPSDLRQQNRIGRSQTLRNDQRLACFQ